jgi:hypothetical protein
MIVTGATGAYGTAAVLLGIAMGAGRVIAAGRNPVALEAWHGLAVASFLGGTDGRCAVERGPAPCTLWRGPKWRSTWWHELAG